jgi:holo-[acyl-carrier protein] synthase
MELAGIGTEIVECLRIRRMIEEHGEQFLLRVFTEAEVRFCQSRRHATEQFAARWAAKEAVLKCLGIATGKGTPLTEIETSCDDSNNVTVVIRGGLCEIMAERKIMDVMLAMSFCRAYATATALAIRKPAN